MPPASRRKRREWRRRSRALRESNWGLGTWGKALWRGKWLAEAAAVPVPEPETTKEATAEMKQKKRRIFLVGISGVGFELCCRRCCSVEREGNLATKIKL